MMASIKRIKKLTAIQSRIALLEILSMTYTEPGGESWHNLLDRALEKAEAFGTGKDLIEE